MSEGNFDDFILANMPHFIAVNYQRLLAASTPQERVALALHTYNLGLRALTIGLVTQYLVRDRDSVSDSYLDNLLLQKFPRLTPDAWLQLLFATLQAYEGQRERFFISELYDFFWDTTARQHRQRADVERPFERLTQLSVEFQGELLALQAAGWEKLAEEVLALLRQILGDMAFIGRYDLIRVLNHDDQFYEFELHKGIALTQGGQPLPRQTDLTIENDAFYLRKETQELLPLHPLLVFWNKEPSTSDLVSPDTGVYEDFIYEQLGYLLARLRKTVTDDRNVTAFVTMLYDTIEEVKRKRRQAEKLTWWQLRDICADITQNRMAAVREKYQNDLYLQRTKTHQAFENFLRSEKRCFVLIGKSGVGKSNFCLALNEQLHQSRQDVCVLMYDGAKINMRLSLTESISKDFERRFSLSTRPMEMVWQEIDRVEEIEQRLVILWVDAINENPQARELLQQLDELVEQGWPWLKIVFSSRPETWRTIKRGMKLAEALYYREEGSEALGVELEPFSYSEQIEPFSRQELPAAYARYQQVFQLQTAYDDLPAALREILRDPLSLRLVANTYQKRAIPSTVKVTELIERYIQALIERDVVHEEDLQFLEHRLVPLMVREGQYRNTITPRELKDAGGGLYEAVYSEQVLSDGRRMNEMFTNLNLVDAEILVRQEQGREQRIGFKYERFYEYFVGRHLFELSESRSDRFAFFAAMASQITEKPFVWGAVKQALLQTTREHGSEVVAKLCFTDNQRIKELMVHVLTDLGRDEPEQVERLILPLVPPVEEIGAIGRVRALLNQSGAALDLPARNAGEIAVEVARNLKLRKVLENAARQPDSNIRTAAIRYTYYLWQDDRALGFEILSFLGSKASSGLVPVFTTLESVFGLSLIIFFEHYRDSPVLEQLRSIWQGVIDNVLGIRQSGGRIETMAREFVREQVLSVLMRLIFGWLKSFPSNNIVNSDDLEAFFKLGPQEKALYRRLIRYMDAQGDYSRAEMEQDWMAVLPINNLLVEGVTLMGFVAHAMHHRQIFVPFLKHFFSAAVSYPQANLYASVVPLVLTAMLDDNPHDDEVFDFMVETAAVCQDYYAKHPKMPGMKYEFQAPEANWLAPYIMHHYQREGTVQTEWLETRINKALESKDSSAFFETLFGAELSIVGIEMQEPRAALGAIGLFFNSANDEVNEMSRAFLSRLRLHYPDEVDYFLEEQQATEADQLQVRTNAPNESIGALVGMRAWIFLRSVVVSSDTIRPRVMRIFAQATDCKDLREWVNYFLRDIVNVAYGAEVLRQAK